MYICTFTTGAEPAPGLAELCPWSADGAGCHNDPRKAFPVHPCLQIYRVQPRKSVPAHPLRKVTGAAHSSHTRPFGVWSAFATLPKVTYVHSLVCHRQDCLDRPGQLESPGIGFKHVHSRCVCMYVCTYVRLYVCTYVCMYVCMYVRTYVCMYVCMHVCMYACMHVCM